jgi:hypothetical protein
MKLPKILDDLMLIISKAKVPNATRYDKRLLSHWVDTQRALWLSNEYNKGRDIMNNEVQIINSIEMQIDTASSVATSLPSGIALLKSTVQIPRTIQLQTRDGITAIRPLNKQFARFNYVPREQAVYSGNGMCNRNMIFFFKIDDYLYAKYGTQNLKNNIPTHVSVEGIFESPLEIDDFNNTFDYIWNGTHEYPISMKFVEYIKNAILETNFISMLTAPEDNSANDEHDIPVTSK